MPSSALRIFSVAFDNAEHTGRLLKTLRNRPFFIFQLGIIRGLAERPRVGLADDIRGLVLKLLQPLRLCTAPPDLLDDGYSGNRGDALIPLHDRFCANG